jgi:membrane associated rhomboid family serine protease
LFPLKDNIPTERFPVVTVALIAINVIVYFFLQDGFLGLPNDGAGGDWTVTEYAAYPCSFTGAQDCDQPLPREHEGALVTLLTSMFMHGSLLHLGGNMLFLWIFGNNVEDSMGPVRFVVFYLLGGVAAMAAQTAIDPNSAIPTLGASGAVSAVLGGYIVLYPRARVVTAIFLVFFFTILLLPAALVLGLWFLEQILFAYFDVTTAGTEGGGVAYFAHIGGFVFGLLAIRLFAKRRNQAPDRPAWLTR